MDRAEGGLRGGRFDFLCYSCEEASTWNLSKASGVGARDTLSREGGCLRYTRSLSFVAGKGNTGEARRGNIV